MKTVRLLLVLLFALPSLAAPSKTVSYKSGDDTVQGVVYTPEGNGPFPGLIVIHEWWGLNDWVKEQASRLSDQGYVALAIDLYRGKVATTPEDAHELSRGVPEDRAAEDLGAAVAFLKSLPDVKKNRIGAIGWCMGGGYALDVALEDPTLGSRRDQLWPLSNHGNVITEDSRADSWDLRRKRSGDSYRGRKEVRTKPQSHGKAGRNPHLSRCRARF